MDDRQKITLIDSAEVTRRVAALLGIAGVIGLVVALVLGVITLNSMSNDVFSDVSYTTSARLVAVSTVGFGIGMPSLLLIGVGRLLTMSAIWFEVRGDKPAPPPPPAGVPKPVESDGTI
jgi:hypothetical protein